MDRLNHSREIAGGRLGTAAESTCRGTPFPGQVCCGPRGCMFRDVGNVRRVERRFPHPVWHHVHPVKDAQGAPKPQK